MSGLSGYVVEALVVSNSHLCVKVAACDARTFTESERARVLEVQLTEDKAEHKAFVANIEADNSHGLSVSSSQRG